MHSTSEALAPAFLTPAPASTGLEPLEPRLLLSATLYTVDTLADVVAEDGLLSLREAIQAANTNEAVNEAPAGSAAEADLIAFAPELFTDGPATLLLEHGQLEITSDIEIQGPGSDLLTLDARRRSRVFDIEGESVEVSIQDMAMTRGSNHTGGNIKADAAVLSLAGVTLSLGVANSGGGIYCEGGELSIDRCEITDNVAMNEFGGIGLRRNGTIIVRQSTIANNAANYGGGLGGNDIDLRIYESRVESNSAEHGGGIYLYAGDIVIESSQISDNNYGGYASDGGGLCLYQGTLHVSSSQFIGNAARNGGGILHSSGAAIILDSVISNNQGRGLELECGQLYADSVVFQGNATTGAGGAILVRSGGIGIYNCSITQNVAELGGGMMIDNAFGSIASTDFIGNTASLDGGAMVIWDSNIQINRAAFRMNHAGANGGALNIEDGSIEATYCFIQNNTADQRGGGLYQDDGDVYFRCSLISGNTALQGGGGIISEDSSLRTIRCTIAGNSGEDIIIDNSHEEAETQFENSIVGVLAAEDDDNDGYSEIASLIGIDAGFVRLPSAGADGRWGTADDDLGDFRLRPDSPAINAGHNDPRSNNDIRGEWCRGGTADIGAYEFLDVAADVNGDEVVDILDFVILKRHYGDEGASKAQGDLNGDGVVNVDDFALLKQNYSSGTTARAAAAASSSSSATEGEESGAPAKAPALDAPVQLAWTSPLLSIAARSSFVPDLPPLD